MSEGWTAVGRAREPASGGTVVEPVRDRPARPAATARGPRRLRVALARVDPWTALKVAFLYGLAGLVVLLVAVTLLYGLVDAMGVLSSLRKFLTDVNSTGGAVRWLSFWRIFGVTLVIGAVNVVLFSALVTMSAFLYNVSSDAVGGVELTLLERT